MRAHERDTHAHSRLHCKNHIGSAHHVYPDNSWLWSWHLGTTSEVYPDTVTCPQGRCMQYSTTTAHAHKHEDMQYPDIGARGL
eukprot:252753-Prymnesium_polylepis.1